MRARAILRKSQWDEAIFHVYLGLVMIAPLPFGAVHPWAQAIVACAAGVLIVMRSLLHLADGGEQPVMRDARLSRLMFLWLAFGALLFWAGLQCSAATPLAWKNPIWREAGLALAQSLDGAITVDRGAAFPAVIRLGSYTTVFWLAFHYGRDAARAHKAVIATVVAVSLYAVYGMIERMAGGNHVLWFVKTAYGGDVTATFINRNNFATYAGLGFLSSLALLFRSLAQRVAPGGDRVEWLRDLLGFIEKRGWRTLLGVILIGGALLASHSRGGALATLLGAAAFCVALNHSHEFKKGQTRRFNLIVLLLTGMVVFAGGAILGERLVINDAAEDGRLPVYTLTWEAIQKSPWRGSGIGTFETAFRANRTADIKATFAQAHNSYLESALEIGLPALGLWVAMFLFILARLIRGVVTRRRDAIYPCLGIGATVLVGTHALVDFSLQIPAVAITFAMIAGITMAQSFSSRMLD